jgi:hypothetical protein
LGMTHFTLNQVQNVHQWEKEDLDEEPLSHSEYFALLNEVVASEKVKAEAR